MYSMLFAALGGRILLQLAAPLFIHSVSAQPIVRCFECPERFSRSATHESEPVWEGTSDKNICSSCPRLYSTMICCESTVRNVLWHASRLVRRQQQQQQTAE